MTTWPDVAMAAIILTGFIALVWVALYYLTKD